MVVTVERLAVCGSLCVCETLEQHRAAPDDHGIATVNAGDNRLDSIRR